MTKEEKLENLKTWLERHDYGDDLSPNIIAMITIDLLGWNMTSEEIVWISDNI